MRTEHPERAPHVLLVDHELGELRADVERTAEVRGRREPVDELVRRASLVAVHLASLGESRPRQLDDSLPGGGVRMVGDVDHNLTDGPTLAERRCRPLFGCEISKQRLELLLLVFDHHTQRVGICHLLPRIS